MATDLPDAPTAVVLLYEELCGLARRQLYRDGAYPRMESTELVHEAYLRLADDARVAERGRAYFFGAASNAMRRVLVDAARKRRAARRGGDPAWVALGEDLAAIDVCASDMLDLHRALAGLEAKYPRLARVVELRYFGGLSVEETARALAVSPRTVKRDWSLARAWLHDALAGNH